MANLLYVTYPFLPTTGFPALPFAFFNLFRVPERSTTFSYLLLFSFVRCKILSFFPLALRHPATLQALSWSSCLMIWTFIFRVVFFFIIAFTILLFYSWSFKWLSTEVSLLSCYKTLKYTQFSFFWNVVGAPGSSDILSSFLCAYGFLLFFSKVHKEAVTFRLIWKKDSNFHFMAIFFVNSDRKDGRLILLSIVIAVFRWNFNLRINRSSNWSKRNLSLHLAQMTNCESFSWQSHA